MAVGLNPGVWPGVSAPNCCAKCLYSLPVCVEGATPSPQLVSVFPGLLGWTPGVTFPKAPLLCVFWPQTTVLGLPPVPRVLIQPFVHKPHTFLK